VFVLIQEIKSEYGSHLRWLLPFPGDWHILFNYQPALMKPYADAELSKLAEVSGHRSETLTSLLQCKNFGRTHNFLVQAFETLYRFFSLYLKSLSESEYFSSQQSLQTTEEKLRERSFCTNYEFSVMTSNNELDSFRQRAQSMLSDSATGCSYKGFTKFMIGLAKKQETIQFWYQYLTSDCFAYIALFVGIRYRSGNYGWAVSSNKLQSFQLLTETPING